MGNDDSWATSALITITVVLLVAAFVGLMISIAKNPAPYCYYVKDSENRYLIIKNDEPFTLNGKYTITQTARCPS